jgi:diguanylate cyclase (GGDEF)-like protein
LAAFKVAKKGSIALVCIVTLCGLAGGAPATVPGDMSKSSTSQRGLDRLLPWLRRDPPPAGDASVFSAHAEQARLSEAVLRQAAQMLDQTLDPSLSRSPRVQACCDAMLAATQRLRLAWTWFGAPDTEEIVPQVVAGPAAAYAHGLRIPRTLLTAAGPAYRAPDGGSPLPFNVSSRSLYAPWREAALRHGLRSSVALPLASTVDDQRGIFVLYSDVPDYFTEVGLGLFEAVALLIGAALSHTEHTEQLAREARTDTLTGLHNRAHAQDLFAAFERQRAEGRPLALLLVDLDHFKQINDQHGHPAGDAVLRSSAQALRGLLRRSDGLARWGGEEFMAWLPDTDRASALLVAEKTREQLALIDHALPQGGSLRVTASVGVAELGRGEKVDAALERADQALYAAKHAGRNRVAMG